MDGVGFDEQPMKIGQIENKQILPKIEIVSNEFTNYLEKTENTIENVLELIETKNELIQQDKLEFEDLEQLEDLKQMAGDLIKVEEKTETYVKIMTRAGLQSIDDTKYQKIEFDGILEQKVLKHDNKQIKPEFQKKGETLYEKQARLNRIYEGY